MFITQTYKYILNDTTYISGNVPEGAEIIETMNILNSEEGYVLIRKSNFENMGTSLWLKDGDSQDNYGEKKDDESSDELTR